MNGSETSPKVQEQQPAEDLLAVFLKDAKKSVAFLGAMDARGNFKPFATGAWFTINGVFHLLTAGHVASAQSGNLVAAFNRKDGGVQYLDLEIERRALRADWVFHPKFDLTPPGAIHDLAALPVRINLQDWDILVVPEGNFLSWQSLSELDDIFFLSYEPRIKPGPKVTPIVRSGRVSLIPSDGEILIDAFVFPGNSGSPVFTTTPAARATTMGVKIGGNSKNAKFIGLVSSYIPYEDVAISVQTRQPRISFQENTGLARVMSADLIQELIQSPKFQAQVTRLKKKVQTEETS